MDTQKQILGTSYTIYSKGVKQLLATSIIILLGFSQIFSQSDCCENCPQTVQDGNQNAQFNINIANASNDNLAGSQGVCDVQISFIHQWLGDLEVTLISPSGQEVQLIGTICSNATTNCGCTDGSTYNVNFVPCGTTASPDNHECISCDTGGPSTPGGASIGPPSTSWQNPDLSCSNTDYTGSYHPNDGCLEDFNTGSINGQWTLVIGDFLAQDFGDILSFDITFCDDTGIICNDNDCFAIANIEQTDFPFCQGDVIALDGSSSTPGSYSWTGPGIVSGQGTNAIMIDRAGTYTLTVNTNDGCSHTATYTVTSSGPAPNLSAQVIGTVGCGQTATLDGSASTGNSLTCQWFEDDSQSSSAGVFDSEIAEVDEPGTYYLFCYTGNFCTSQISVEVLGDTTPPTVDAEAVGSIDCNSTTAEITASSNDNAATYEWSGPNAYTSTTATNTVDELGIYMVTVTGANGCTMMDDVEVTGNTNQPDIVINPSSTTIDCSQLTSVLNTSSSFTITDYSWTGPNGYTSTDDSPIILSGGTYSLTVTASNGCTNTTSVIINEEGDLPDVMTSVSGSIDCNNMSVNLTGSSTTSDVTYSWTGPGTPPFTSTQASPTGITVVGTYTLTVTAPNGCSDDSDIEVEADLLTPQNVVVNVNELDCSEASELMTVTSSNTLVAYSWTLPSGMVTNNATANSEGIGNYNVVVTGTNGCTTSLAFQIEDTTAPVINNPANDIIVECNGTGNNQDLNNWLNNNGNAVASDACGNITWSYSPNPVILSDDCGETGSATVTFTATDDAGNTATTTGVFTIEDNNAPSINIQPSDLIVEFDDNGNPTNLQAWLDAVGGMIASDACSELQITYSPNPIVLNTDCGNTANTPVTFTITDECGRSTTASANAIVNIEAPDASITVTNDVLNCGTNGATLTANSTTPNVTYEWQGPVGSTNTMLNITQGQGGVYTLIVTAPNGCTSTDMITITEDFSPPQNISTTTNTIDCDNQSITIGVATSTTDVLYDWTGPNSFIANTANPMVSEAGMYQVVLTNQANQCTTSVGITVASDIMPPNASAQGGVITCQDEMIEITGSSTTTNVSYAWTGPNGFTADIANPEVNTAGTYTLIVTGSNACTATATAMVDTDANLPEISASSVDGVTELNCGQNSIQLEGSSATAGASLLWTFPDASTTTNMNPEITIAGIYTLSATAANGCESTATVTISDNFATPQNPTASNATIYCDPNTVEIVASTDDANVTYEWTGPNGFNSNIANPTVNEAGMYAVIMTATNGCTAMATATVNEDTNIPTLALNADVLTCNNNSIIIESTTDATVNYAWTGPNGFTSDQANPSVSEAGIYTLEIINTTSNCPAIEMIEVQSNITEPQLIATADIITCAESTTTLEVSSDISGVTYAWTGPAGFTSNEQNPTTQTAGVYTVIATATNGCTGMTQYEVEENVTTPNITVTGGTLTCADTDINLMSNSTSNIIAYAWTGPNGFTSDQANPTVTESGNYTLTITGDNGCDAIASTMVEEDGDIPDASAIGNTIDCNNNIVEITGNSETPNVTYAWTGPAGFTSNIANPMVSEAGDYELTVMADNGCEKKTIATVIADLDTPNLSAQGALITCDQQEVTLMANSTTDNVTYEWTGPTGFTTTTDQNPMTDIAGNYDLIVTAANGCPSMETVVVLEDTTPPDAAITINGDDTIDCNTPAVALEGTSTTPGVTYAWIAPNNINSNTNTIAATVTGEYILITTASNGCERQEMIVIEDDFANPNLSATGGTLTCAINEIVLEATSTDVITTYEWTGLNFNSNISNPIVTEVGEYTITATGENGCESSILVDVDEDRVLPEVSAIGNTIDCNNELVSIMGSSSTPNVTYEWSGPDNYSSTLENPMIDVAGNYILTINSDDNGCENTATAIVLADLDTPDIALEGGTITCSETSIQLMANTITDNVTYEWTGPTGFATTDDQNPTTTFAGNYELVATAANGCTSMENIEIFEDTTVPDVTININGDDIIDCDTPAVELEGTSTTSGVTYAWAAPNNINSNTNIIAAMVPGEFILTATASNGCDNQEMIAIEQDTISPNLSATGGTLTCIENEITLEATSTDVIATYEWVGLNFNSNISNPTATNAGEYIITATAENGCTSSMAVVIEEDRVLPEVSVIGNTIDCNNELVSIMGSSSTPNVTYEWSGPNNYSSTLENPMIDVAGDYILTINSDDNGCENTATATVLADLDTPDIALEGGTITCSETSIQLMANTTTDNVTYEWTGPTGFATTDDQNPTTTFTGNYELVATADNGCTSMESIEVFEDTTLPDATIGINGDNIIDCDTPEVELEGSSMTTGVIYTWTDPNNIVINNNITNASIAGEYILAATAPNDCITEVPITIAEDFSVPNIDATGGILTCGTSELELTASSTTPNVNYEWTGPNQFTSNIANPTIMDAGTYNLTIVGENACTSSMPVAVLLDDRIPVLAAETDSVTCLITAATLDASASTPAGDSLVYQWYFGSQTIGNASLVEMVQEAGLYTLIGTNNNNACADTLAIEVIENTSLPIANAGDDAELTCDNTTAFLDGSTSTGQGDLTYEWTNSAGEIISTASGVDINFDDTISLTITDEANGCTSEDEAVVVANNLNPVVDIAAINPITCSAPTSLLDASNSSPQSNNGTLSYCWRDMDGNIIGTESSIAIAEAGMYTLLLKDISNACNTSTAPLTVIEDTELPLANIALPEIITCKQEEIQLDGSESSTGGVYTYNWTSPDNLSITNANTLMPTINQGGTYILMIQNTENDCISEAMVSVEEDKEIPIVVAQVMDSFDCVTEEVILFGQGSSIGEKFVYLWEGIDEIIDSTMLNATVTHPGSYTLNIENIENGCQNSQDVLVEDNTNEIEIVDYLAEDESCVGEVDGLIVFNADNITGGTPPYMYALNGDVLSSNTQYLNLTPGNYTLAIEDALGCAWSDNIVIEAAIPINLELGEDITVTLGETIILNADANPEVLIDSIAWSLDSLSGNNPTYTPTNSNTIVVTVVDENNCEDSDEIVVLVDKNRPVYIPSSFSPNGDGVNDYFTVFGGSSVEQVTNLQVYDRWGNMLYSQNEVIHNNETQGWDGNFRNQLMDEGVYIYYVEVKFIDGHEEVYHGDLTIVR